MFFVKYCNTRVYLLLSHFYQEKLLGVESKQLCRCLRCVYLLAVFDCFSVTLYVFGSTFWGTFVSCFQGQQCRLGLTTAANDNKEHQRGGIQCRLSKPARTGLEVARSIVLCYTCSLILLVSKLHSFQIHYNCFDHRERTYLSIHRRQSKHNFLLLIIGQNNVTGLSIYWAGRLAKLRRR